MKKFGKFLFGTLSLVALAGGAFYFLKNVVNKDTEDDFDDFEDDFEDFDTDDDLDLNNQDSREYVPINLSESEDNIDSEDTMSDNTLSDEISSDDTVTE